MQPRVYQHIRAGLAIAAFAGYSLATSAASNFTPQNGNWNVSSELNGQPGRGMTIDVQDGTLVLQVYNYLANGAGTFHLAAGKVVDNRVVAPLKHYRGGRYFGSGPLSGTEDGDAGSVTITFTSGSTGTVQFPGEQPVAMERYRFEGVPTGKLAYKYWMLALLDEQGKPADMQFAATGPMSLEGVEDAPGILFASEFGGSSSEAAMPCKFTQATSSFRCLGPSMNIEFNEYIRQLSGTITRGGKTYRMVGMRMLGVGGGDMEALSTYVGLASVPDSGGWIVSNELDGKPGRGLAIDVQNGTLVMQVYNYNAAGNATFHLAVSPYKESQGAGALRSYAGGRWFGSGPRSGTEASDAGPMYLLIETPNRGVVRFPGEGPLTIQRYRFGPKAPEPASLLGTWALRDDTNKKLVTLALTTVEGEAALGDGVICRYTDAATQQVRCTSSFSIAGRGTVYATDYRFQVQDALAVGKALPSGVEVANGSIPDDSKIKLGTLWGLRLVDRNGVQTGLGPLR